MNLLLFSNSTNFGEPYFDYPTPYIEKFLAGKSRRCLFFPYAGVTVSWDDYEKRIAEKFLSLGHELISVHRLENAVQAIHEADVIVVGGGNTFNLVYWLQKLNLMENIRQRVLSEIPFIGWSAGSNVTCQTICTTNDMPVIQPKSFDALNLIPFQINPHFTEGTIPNHGGETREARILEYLEINQDRKVLGLREGSLIQCLGEDVHLLGRNGARLYSYGAAPVDILPGDSISFIF
jgi:dipeptidase E